MLVKSIKIDMKIKTYINIINKMKKRCGLFCKLWYNRIVRIDNVGKLCPKKDIGG